MATGPWIGTTVQAAPATTTNTNTIVGSSFLFQLQQTRYILIALGCVSMALSLWVVTRVFYDSWRAIRLQIMFRKGCVQPRNPSENRRQTLTIPQKIFLPFASAPRRKASR